MKTKQSTINKILQRMGVKPIALLNDPKKKKGLILTGRIIPKVESKEPVVKPHPKPLVKARPRVKTVTAVANTEEREILALLDTEPSKAIEMLNKRNARIAAERKERNRYLALSDREKKREAEVKEKTKEAIKSLTSNLGKLDVNPNWNHSVIWDHIAKMCFESSLLENIYWSVTKTGTLQFKILADKITMPYKQLDLVAEKLIALSGIKFNSTEYNGLKLHEALSNAASSYQIEQAKRRSSEWYHNQLVALCADAHLDYLKDSATRSDVLNALAISVAELGIDLGYYRDKAKSIYIDSSDMKFGSTLITRKTMIPYMEKIIKGSTVAGRLKGSSDPDNLLTGFINLLTL